MSRVLTIGETMGVAITAVGHPLRTTRHLGLSTAGAESTVAIGLSRLGHSAEWVGVLGDDEVGARVRRDLQAERVGTTFVRTVSTAPTGFMLRERATAELTRVSYYRRDSAGSLLEPDDVRPAVDGGADLLHVTGITPALSPSGAAAVIVAVEKAVAAGIPVSLDVNYRRTLPLSGHAKETAAQLLSSVDVLFVGHDELWLVSDEPDPMEAAKELLGRGPSEVVVKRGPDPAIGMTADGEVAVHPSWPVQVVDIVGAGDSFVAGYLAARCENRPLTQRLRWGTICAASTVGAEGDWEGLPTRTELESREATAVTIR